MDRALCSGARAASFAAMSYGDWRVICQKDDAYAETIGKRCATRED